MAPVRYDMAASPSSPRLSGMLGTKKGGGCGAVKPDKSELQVDGEYYSSLSSARPVTIWFLIIPFTSSANY